jgi:hypothetical protein
LVAAMPPPLVEYGFEEGALLPEIVQFSITAFT